MVLLGGCGGARQPAVNAPAATSPTRFVATGYQPDPARGVVLAIAPVPMAGDLAGRIDVGLDRVFGDTPGFQLRVQSAQLRIRMNGDRQLVLLMNRIFKLEDEWRPGTPAPGLDSFLATHELARLREVLTEADVLLVPSAFEFQSEAKATSGTFTARLYDLRNGRLLLRDTFRQRVTGAGAEVGVAMELVLGANASIARDLAPNAR
jgi:hypothetical protein